MGRHAGEKEGQETIALGWWWGEEEEQDEEEQKEEVEEGKRRGGVGGKSRGRGRERMRRQ